MFPYEINPIGIVGSGVLDRPLIQQNLRTVREAGPYTHRIRLCEIKELHKPEFVDIFQEKSADMIKISAKLHFDLFVLNIHQQNAIINANYLTREANL